MTAWGKTGRVEVVDALTDTAVNVGICRVLVDGAFAGMIWPWGGRSLVSLGDGWVDEEPATRDEAIMWVLRRARPDVWREERGEVGFVRRYRFSRGWFVCNRSGRMGDVDTWEEAMSVAATR